MISRPESPVGQGALRIIAFVLLLLPVLFWFSFFVVPGDERTKMLYLWIIYGLGLALVGTGLWLYRRSFYEAPPTYSELPVHAQLVQAYTVVVVALTTLFVLVAVGEGLRH